MIPLKEYIKSVIGHLNEGYNDIAELGLSVRMKVSSPKDPTVMDILTDIRALSSVITVKQAGAMSKANFEGKQTMPVHVNFVPNGQDAESLALSIKEIRGIDLVKIYTVNGERYSKDGKPFVT